MCGTFAMPRIFSITLEKLPLGSFRNVSESGYSSSVPVSGCTAFNPCKKSLYCQIDDVVQTIDMVGAGIPDDTEFPKAVLDGNCHCIVVGGSVSGDTEKFFEEFVIFENSDHRFRHGFTGMRSLKTKKVQKRFVELEL
jgi:hypothetical protein